jgi:leucyl-tRNA synthetase
MEYNFTAIEAKWQEFWECNESFKSRFSVTSTKKFYCLDMFPYPSGSGLHLGHPLGYTGTDIISRYKRMNGFDVLHPMGFDAFGLPAEQHAINTGEHPAIVTQRNCDYFVSQLKKIGLSYDWSRLLNTTDPEYYKWTQYIFLQLYNSWFDRTLNRARPISELPLPEHLINASPLLQEEYRAKYRLAYYAEAHVNFCPALGTVLANEEVINGRSERGNHEVIRLPMKQWMLRITEYAERLIEGLKDLDWPESIKEQQYNWIGRREGATIDFKVLNSPLTLTAFTTRPDTLPGVTFIVIAPEHPLVEELTKASQKSEVEGYLEATKRLSDLNRTLDSREKSGVLLGALAINPFNGAHVPVYVADYVLATYGTGIVMGVPAHDERDAQFAEKYSLPSVPVEEGAHDIANFLEQKGVGKRVIKYKLRDWLFSRQRYWGEPIPIIHWEDGEVTPLTLEELPLQLPELSEFHPSTNGESPLARATSWLKVIDPKSGRLGRRETHTMPQWAGSCWYYLRFINPHNKERFCDATLEKHFMPVDLYVGGAEHAVLHLLYARFWHKVLFDLNLVSTDEPFQKLYNQGTLVNEAFQNERGSLIPTDEVIEGEDGSYLHRNTGEKLKKIMGKMSKSLKNVIDPLEIVKEFGADTLRVYLMFMGPFDAMRPWDDKAILGSHRFLKRIWNLVQNHLQSNSDDKTSFEVTALIHQTIRKVTLDTDSLKFNTAIASMMELLNNIDSTPLCRQDVKTLVLLLSPYAPHIAEELWQLLGEKESLSYAPWPAYDEALTVQKSVEVVIQINGKKRGSVTVACTLTENELKVAVIEAMAKTNYPVKGDHKFITVFNKENDLPRLVNVIC